MDSQEKPRIDPATVVAGRSVQRRPNGRQCVIVEVRDDRTKVKVSDPGSSVFWVSMRSLVENWA